MKLILLAIFITLPAWSHGSDVTNESMQREFNQIENLNGQYGMFKLTHSKDEGHYAILDCQSFFQKMDFYTPSDSNGIVLENFITMDECEEIYSNIKWCFEQNKNKCFDPNAVLMQSCECI